MVKRFKPLGTHLYIDHIYRIGTYYYYHTCNFEGRTKRENAATFFIAYIFFCLRSWRGHLNNWGESGGYGCMYIQEWFKPIFPLFLTWLLRKSKFIVPTADSPSPLNIINQVTLTTITGVCYYISEEKRTLIFSTLNLCVISKFHSRKCCNSWLWKVYDTHVVSR